VQAVADQAFLNNPDVLNSQIVIPAQAGIQKKQ
jgi:hypothetical protein